jgi:hypothetical protein
VRTVGQVNRREKGGSGFKSTSMFNLNMRFWFHFCLFYIILQHEIFVNIFSSIFILISNKMFKILSIKKIYKFENNVLM